MTDDLHHLASAYALNALDTEETLAFEAHYARCSICQADVTTGRAVAARLASAEQVAPPVDLKGKVMAEITQTRQVSPLQDDNITRLAPKAARPASLQRQTSLLAAAAVLVVVVAGALFVLRDTDPSIDEELASVREAPDALRVDLAGPGAGDVSVVWSAEQEQIGLTATDLPEAGAEQTYVLWLLNDDGAQSAGLFVPDDSGKVGEVLSLEGSPAAWGVTLEPAGGSPQPTGDILFLGEAPVT